MAYFILNPNETDKTKILRIAANDADKANLFINERHQVIEVSDEEFNSLRNQTKRIIGHDGSNYQWEESPPTAEPVPLPPENQGEVPFVHAVSARLRRKLDNTIEICDAFLTEMNVNHPWYSSIETYRNFIRDFDVDSLSFPMYITWEKYCEDNGINYYHPLQIP
tara:strand:+ start:49 stop:543 length:495 start_codon:yes stop_codon:yes gene_type:complete